MGDALNHELKAHICRFMVGDEALFADKYIFIPIYLIKYPMTPGGKQGAYKI